MATARRGSARITTRRSIRRARRVRSTSGPPAWGSSTSTVSWGDADQWTPGSLFRDTTHIEPFLGNPQWNLITAMADDAIQWMNELNDINPNMPFLLYYCPGGTH